MHLEVDGEDVENEYSHALVNMMYERLNYGSWAGEFEANGEAIYDPKTNSFEGTDYYGEDGNTALSTDFRIEIPKKLWFETLHIEVEANYDDTPSVSVRFIIKNGFLTDEHTDFCRNLEDILEDHFTDMFTNFESTDAHEFRGANDSWILEKAKGIEKDDMLVFTLDEVDVQTIDRDERNIVLELDEEIAAAIDEQLNDE